MRPKENSELSANSLQSSDDLEAAYREKRGKGYQGYVANLTETCDPENPLQLITKVQVAPNNVDDSQLLAEALPDLKKRTNLETVYADGGYGGPQSDPVLQAQDVALIQTAIRGQKRNLELLYLDDFAPAQEEEQDVPQQMTCPAGQTLRVALSASGKTYQADLPPEVCAGCEQRALSHSSTQTAGGHALIIHTGSMAAGETFASVAPAASGGAKFAGSSRSNGTER